MTAISETITTAPTRRDWLGLGALAAGLGMIVLDGTIVGVALPDIVADLHLTLSDAQWVGSLYAAVLAALLLSAGRLADRWGRKRLFLVGIVVFVLGSLWAATASGAGSLIAARAGQAIGAAMIMPSTLSTVNATFRGKYRAAAFGVWGAVISGAAAVGPLAGGALTQYASWPWIFLVNLPLGALVFAAAIFTVRETKDPGVKKRGGDVLGAVFSAIGFAALVFVVIEGPDLGWWTPKEDFAILGFTWPATAPVSLVVPLAVVAVLGIAGFLVWEQQRARRGRPVLLDLTLFRLPTFSWGNLTAGTIAVGEFAIVFVLPLCLVNALGFDAMGAGLILAGMALGAFVSGALARHLARALGAPGVVIVGLVLEVIGVGTLALLLRPDSAGGVLAIPLVVYGLGLGLASAQLTGTVLRDVPVAQSGQGSATQSTVRQVGSALGTALAGAALSIALAMTLPAATGDAGLSGAHVDQAVQTTRSSAGATISVLRAQHGGAIVDALSAGFTDATRVALLVAGVFLVLGLVGALRVRAVARHPAP
ncbi:DHA2 family efflux MFS transporter permease subunit [Microbacterium horticulturae]|uniref:DHA2 family efflux MFS transporter permease subunit n=1 Tax=Microbacterium horticulturae TaxID=3028316 RepID=A0ABY8C1G0_9MICO|nr:DHA2 family efflux MFS transporter permease subunit [Microbacterium sp. KACC 23027]WEG10268.1 DHA2 family efflux MFS transporter permease subunit [Microbacterium sp. KACC 23027]